MKSKNISKAKKNELSLNDTEQSILLDTIYDGEVPSQAIKDQLKVSLRTFYKYLEKNPKFKSEFDKAQEIGIKVLVEKMLQIFNTNPTHIENNELLFLREKQSFLKWIAPRVSSLFTEKQKIDIKSDSKIQISWEENSEDILDISENVLEVTPPDIPNKGN